MHSNIINQSHQAVHKVFRVYVLLISKSLYPLVNMLSLPPPCYLEITIVLYVSTAATFFLQVRAGSVRLACFTQFSVQAPS